MPEPDQWPVLLRWTPLFILADLDCTPVPFAPTLDEERPGPELIDPFRSLAAAPGVTLAVVSGRSPDRLAARLDPK
jgi:trehalose-6-phosphatase